MIVIPFIGSKYRIAYILEGVLKDNKPELYIEPFSGGFSLGLNLLGRGLVDKTVLNDLNEGVYNFWKHIKEDPFTLVNETITIMEYVYSKYGEDKVKLSKIEADLGKLNFGAVELLLRRSNWGKTGDSIQLRSEDVSIDFTDKILDAHRLLTATEVSNKDYSNLLESNNKNTTFWFLDPPYLAHPNDSYYGVGNGFSHIKLKEFIDQLKGNFILCYGDNSSIRDLYSSYNIYPYLLGTSMGKVGYSQELIITNMDLPVVPVDYIESPKDYKAPVKEEFENITLEEFILGGIKDVESK